MPEIFVHNLRGRVLRPMGAAQLLITRPSESFYRRFLSQLKGPNLIYIVGHLIAYRKYTGRNNILLKISKSAGKLKITARVEGFTLVVDKNALDRNEVLKYLHLGAVDSLRGQLIIESSGKGIMYFLRGDERRQESFISYIKRGTLITALISSY